MKQHIVNGFEITVDEKSDTMYFALGGEFEGYWDVRKDGRFVAHFKSLAEATDFANSH